MSQTERLYKIKNLLDAGQCLTKARLLEELAISPATLKRDIAHLRDRMNAPIAFDRERKGWHLDLLRYVPEVKVLGPVGCGKRRGKNCGWGGKDFREAHAMSLASGSIQPQITRRRTDDRGDVGTCSV